MKIVADDKIPYLRGALEPHAQVVYLPGAAIGPDDLKDAQGLITRTRTKCNRGLLAGSGLRFIASATAGYDHIDAGACRELGISWTSSPGCNADSVVQYVASALLSLRREKGLELEGRTMGIVGCGQVGGRIARLASALGMEVLLNDPPRARDEGPDGFVDLSRIQARADVITFHVSLNLEGPDRSVHLADGAFLAGLAQKPLLINASRGEVVDGAALKKHLQKGSLWGAVLDVFENEPQLDLELMGLLDFATPHIAGYSADGKLNGTTMSVRAMSRFFGLGIDDWEPDNPPVPRDPRLVIDCRGKSDLDIIDEAVMAAYRVAGDDRRLRDDPQSFEKQRGDYPVRRDFRFFHVELKNRRGDIGQRLENMGFNLI